MRKNERKEWEFLGGKLEVGETIESRLVIEFLEESGIRVLVTKHAEPWLYTIGIREVLILPYHCDALHIPSKLQDLDGGELSWFTLDEIHRLPIPKGYLDSILNKIPQASFSSIDKPQTTIITKGFEVFVSIMVEDENGMLMVKNDGKNSLPTIFLESHYTPRIALKNLLRQLGISANTTIHSLPPYLSNGKVYIPYYLVEKHILTSADYKLLRNIEFKG